MLELASIRQGRHDLDPVGGPRTRVAAGGLLRLYLSTRSTESVALALTIGDRAVEREVTVTPLDPLTRRGRSVRRAFYRGLLDDWIDDYRRTRASDLRQQIVDVSLREGIPTALTALHVASTDRTLARTATPGPLLCRVGILLLLVGVAILAGDRRWAT